MNTDKMLLTPQIAAAYWGCNVKWKEHTYSSRHLFKGLLDNLMSDCQLILKPVSEISDEDAIYIAKEILGYRDGYDEYFIESTKRYLKSGNDIMLTQQIIDFLRSKGYDVGYGSIKSLIESGIAIVNNLK